MPVRRSSRGSDGVDGGTGRGRNRPKLKDVAEACGVSIGTVSRVLNGDAEFSIRDTVRQQILEAASELGYAPDLAARSLHNGTTQILGVFGSPHTHVSEGINDAIFAGIAEAVRGYNYDVFFELTSHHTVARPLPFWRFDGAILIQSPEQTLVEALNNRRIPYVSVNETQGQPAACVISDDRGGTTQAMIHLDELGHRRIAYTNGLSGYFPHYSTAERRDNITYYCRVHGLDLVTDDTPFEGGQRFLQQAVLDRKATAVIAYDHRIAIDVLGAAYQLNLAIPQDFSLLCFNDEFPVSQVYPPLTVISVSGREMGREATSLLMRIIDRQSPTSPGQPLVRVPEHLIVRDSTAAPRRR